MQRRLEGLAEGHPPESPACGDRQGRASGQRLLAALLLCAPLAACCRLGAPQAAANPVLRAETKKPFAEVVADIESAIVDHNYRITGTNKIGAALRERGYQGFPDVEVIHFCNLESAREVLELDPGFVALMPCRITVHEQAGRTVVSLNLLPENHPDARVNAYARRTNDMLRAILAFALEENAEVLGGQGRAGR